jgi:predicted lipoprotein with Yx(FWY)xxD motif
MAGKFEIETMRRTKLPVHGMLLGVIMTFMLMPLHASAASKAVSDMESMLAPVKTPPGIGKRVTYFGAVFTDKQGMTLYVHTSEWPCIAARRTLPPGVPPLLRVYAKSSVPFCTDQWPPLMASANDTPVGDWTIVDRPDGQGKQWAYKDLPVHRSYKDELPGDVNGPTKRDFIESQSLTNPGFAVADAPMILPPGVRVIYVRPYGLIATTESGPLYKLAAPSTSTDALKTVSLACSDCSEDKRWKPFPAGAMAGNLGLWTVVSLSDGAKAWAYKGEILYTYTVDQESRNTKGLGVNDKASLLTLNPMPMAPRGITVQRTLVGPVYADSRGMTAYQFFCTVAQPGEARRSEVAPNYWCDSLGVDTTFREMFCTAPDKCGERWRPVEAPPETQPQGGAWSVAVIPDKRYSLRWEPAKAGEKLAPGAVKVWTHRGRPIFTSAYDEKPGEMWGHDVQLDENPLWQALRAGEPEERGIAAGN